MHGADDFSKLELLYDLGQGTLVSLCLDFFPEKLGGWTHLGKLLVSWIGPFLFVAGIVTAQILGRLAQWRPVSGQAGHSGERALLSNEPTDHKMADSRPEAHLARKLI